MNNTKSAISLMSVDDVAAHLLVSSKTIRRWIGAGLLPAHRLGRQIRIAEDDVRRFIAQRKE